jgi:hypothetical protein
LAFQAKARAAETARKTALADAHTAAMLMRTAYHKPNAMPTLAKLLGGAEPKPTGADRRSFMKGLAAKHGKVQKRGRG